MPGLIINGDKMTNAFVKVFL